MVVHTSVGMDLSPHAHPLDFGRTAACTAATHVDLLLGLTGERLGAFAALRLVLAAGPRVIPHVVLCSAQ